MSTLDQMQEWKMMSDLSERAVAWQPIITYQGKIRVAVMACFHCQYYVGKCRAETLPSEEVVVCKTCREKFGYGDKPVLRTQFIKKDDEIDNYKMNCHCGMGYSHTIKQCRLYEENRFNKIVEQLSEIILDDDGNMVATPYQTDVRDAYDDCRERGYDHISAVEAITKTHGTLGKQVLMNVYGIGVTKGDLL